MHIEGGKWQSWFSVFSRILLALLLVAFLLPRLFTALLETLMPAPPEPGGPHVREVWAPVRVSTFWEEIEVWWHFTRWQLREYYLGH